jgi:hypothetical protein
LPVDPPDTLNHGEQGVSCHGKSTRILNIPTEHSGRPNDWKRLRFLLSIETDPDQTFLGGDDSRFTIQSRPEARHR